MGWGVAASGPLMGDGGGGGAFYILRNTNVACPCHSSSIISHAYFRINTCRLLMYFSENKILHASCKKSVYCRVEFLIGRCGVLGAQ